MQKVHTSQSYYFIFEYQFRNFYGINQFSGYYFIKNPIFISLIAAFFIISCKKETENSTGNNQEIYFYEGQLGSGGNSVLMSNDSCLVICGQTGENSLIFKVKRNGVLVWKRILNDSTNWVSAITKTNDNCFILCGHSYNSVNDQEVLLVKINTDGDIVWTKSIGTENSEYGSQIINTTDNNFIVSGLATENIGSLYLHHIFIAKINSSGDTLWTRKFIEPLFQLPSHIIETMDGNFIVSGTTYDTLQSKVWLIKIDPFGNTIWEKTIDATGGESACSIIECNNGELFVGGSRIYSNNLQQILLLKLSNLGDVLWEKEFEFPQRSAGPGSMKLDSDGSVILVGSSSVYPHLSDAFVLKVDNNGNEIWRNIQSISDKDLLSEVIEDDNGVNILIGQAQDVNMSDWRITITKIDRLGRFK